MLYIVPTPIGNLEDITYRAINVLKSASYILAEDTRTSRPLLKHYEIETPMRAHHAHNEHHAVTQIITDLAEGKTVALIIEAGIEVSCLPGATAFVPALVNAGLPCDRFYFEGFLPHKKGRQTRLTYIAALDQTVVLYESPHRLVKCLGQLIEFCGEERPVVVCREISKFFEDKIRGTLREVVDYFAENPSKVKGEIVIVLGGLPAKKKKHEKAFEERD